MDMDMDMALVSGIYLLATWPLAVRFCAAHPSGLD